jgi:hypothetical protein
MGKLLYSETRENGNCDCVHEDPTQLENTLTENVPCPCPLTGKFTNNRGLTISKTRGVPSMGNPNRGARGQELAFRNASGKYRNSMSRMDDNDPHWYSYARNGKRVSYPVHPPLYMARNNDFRPKATPIHPPLYQSRRGMTPIHPPLYQSRRSTGYRRFSGDENGTMMTMSVGKLLMGYLAVGLSAFVVGYAIKKGCDTAK